jgi:riboflavin kinase/FMN adenylyltransferase
MLGHPYRVRGVVGTGAARGRTIGFPTANLEAITTLLPPDGVYAGRCRVVDSATQASGSASAPRFGAESCENLNNRFGESDSKLTAGLTPSRSPGITYLAAINLGPNPTFGESVRKFEAHLLDFSGDLYGRALDVDLIARVRDTVRFASSEALMQQLKADQIAVHTLANGAGGE